MADQEIFTVTMNSDHKLKFPITKEPSLVLNSFKLPGLIIFNNFFTGTKYSRIMITFKNLM
uniref:Unkown protein n=1 Tax=Riptortus pedestris TaxID=329032 RepID=R4WDZ3_RIPPE|nr:unkown protein [Riptortus pedestris]